MIIQGKIAVEKKALPLYKENPHLADAFLTDYCANAALKSLELAKKLSISALATEQ